MDKTPSQIPTSAALVSMISTDEPDRIVIAIDGPAASGKTTVGLELADQLNLRFLDTGSMYRALTWFARQRGVEVNDEEAVTALAHEMAFDVRPISDESSDGRHYTVLLNGRDVTWDIRRPEVDANVSQVARYAQVRKEMVKRQRKFAEQGNIVLVGRDIGTVVIPEAPLKLYITASAEERARRRWRDRDAQGYHDTYETILTDVQRRDEIDSTRRISPLRPAEDAVEIDTTNQTARDVVAVLIELVGR